MENEILYIGDIPSEYHYAVFSDNHIDLYNTPNLQGTLNYYRIFLYDNYFAYDFRQTTYQQYNYSIAKNINVSNEIKYKPNFINIVTCTFIFAVFGVFLINLFTSFFRKGGVFSGLL